MNNFQKGQKRSNGPKTYFFQGGGSIPGHCGFLFLYQRVFWVPLGGSDGYSPVGLHADLSTTRSRVRFPRPAGGGIRTCDLVVERSACQTTELPPSHKIPSGTQNTLRYKQKQNPKICPNMSQYAPFLRDHLFVTTRVHIKDGNFLIGAPFVSDRPRHLFFRPKTSVLGPVDVFGPFSTIFEFSSGFFLGGLHKSRNTKVFCGEPLGR